MSGLRPFPELGAADVFDVASEISTYETGLGDYLGAKVGEGIWSSLPGQAAANMRVPDAMPTDDELEVRSRMSGVPAAQIRANLLKVETPSAPTETTLGEQEWKASPWHRPGIEWDPRMTEPRAKALAAVNDENTYRRWLIERSPTGLRSIAGFAAQMLGGAPDPVNYIPWFGPAARAAAAARMAKTLGPTASRVVGAAAVQGTEAMVGTAAIEPFLLPSMRQFGDDVGFADAVMDVAFSGLFGAAFGGGVAGWHAYKDRGVVHDVPAQAAGAQLLSHAAGDVAAGLPPNLHPLMDGVGGLADEIEQLRRAVREVDADPVGDPFQPLAEMRSEDLGRVIMARGGWRRINDLEVSRQGWGLVKIIWKHGWKSDEPAHLKVHEGDVLALPEILRTHSPDIEPERGGGAARWVVDRDHPLFGSRRLVYAVNQFVDGRAGDGRVVVSVHVADPNRPGGLPPLSARKAGPGNGNADEWPVAPGDGYRAPRDTPAASAQPVTQGQAGSPATANIDLFSPGRTPDVAITSTGRKVPVAYEVVEAASLVTSHGDDLEANPKYPAELQPRDRARPASAEQIGAIAADPIPELLGRTGSAADGAPIVGPDSVVESGNGRVLGLRRAFQQNPEGAARYRAFLERQGFDVASLREPILVRRRVDDLEPEDRAAFAREANERTTLAMGATERAMADAKDMPDSLFDAWRGGEIHGAGNRDFVRGWLATLPQTERGALVDAKGALSQQGVDRLQAALLARAYDDPHLVARLAESTDDNTKTIGKVLTETAPDWIKLRAAVREGLVVADMDQTAALMQAVGIVRQARDKGLKVGDLADQLDLFDPQADEVRSFLHLMYGKNFYGRPLGYDKLRASIGRYVDMAMQNIAGPRLIGEPVSARQILAGLRSPAPKALDATPVPERGPDPDVKAAAERAARPAGNVKSLAAELGVDLRTGEFDDEITFRQLDAEGRIQPGEANAVRDAEALMARADNYADAYEAAAFCMGRSV